ncbi:MAG TPA: hypothetical protein VEA41_09990 [Salinarimonas sp.]|nr:hypothetical protein [Salinarimonas sp.]
MTTICEVCRSAHTDDERNHWGRISDLASEDVNAVSRSIADDVVVRKRRFRRGDYLVLRYQRALHDNALSWACWRLVTGIAPCAHPGREGSR